MSRLLLAMAAFLLFMHCTTDDGKCREPGSACDNCIRIYDMDGNYISGGSLSGAGSGAYWDGKDCHGDSVPCGKYRVDMFYQGQYVSNEVVVSGPGAIIRNERSVCDSLEAACKGFFHEEETFSGLTCICCE